MPRSAVLTHDFSLLQRTTWREGYDERSIEIKHVEEKLRQAESKRDRTIQSAAGRIAQIRDETNFQLEDMRHWMQAVQSAHIGPQRQITDATAMLHTQLEAQQAEFLRAKTTAMDAELALVDAKAAHQGLAAEAAEAHQAYQHLEAQLAVCMADCERAADFGAHASSAAQRSAAEAAAAMSEAHQLRSANMQLHTCLAAQQEEMRQACEQHSAERRQHEAEAVSDARLHERIAELQGDLHVGAHMPLLSQPLRAISRRLTLLSQSITPGVGHPPAYIQTFLLDSTSPA